MQIGLVNMDETVRPVVQAAARQAFPGATVHDTQMTAAAGEAAPGFDLLLLLNPDAPAVAAAVQAEKADGSPRWAVLLLTDEPSDLAETLPAADWSPGLLARTMRAVRLQHDLVCENHRLRGDLKTVARRISHELRTPLGCIHTSADLLTEPQFDKAAALASAADVFRQSSGEISQIIDRMSFLLRASAGPAPAAAVEMGSILRAALHQLETEVRAREAVVMQPDSWPPVTGVASWLQVVWWNLLHNALRHAGPRVQVQVTWISRPGDYCFSVADSGRGVAPAREENLFAPFDRLHALRTGGLGLAIVQRLVTLQGGRCDYEKTPAGGARFCFTLPKIPSSA
jgi:signal transduction histidine kinase